MQEGRTTSSLVPLAWCGICGLLVGFAGCLVWFGDHFAWHRKLEEIPALWLTGGLITAGLIYLIVIPLINWTLRQGVTSTSSVLGLIVVAGLVMRAIMIPATPALEDDFYRYLWDGAVTAKGYNPYALAPAETRAAAAPHAIQRLGQEGALVLDRVNHPKLKTIYPPVTQGAFALAHWIEPWSLRAWRLVCLIGECASLGLILLLLGTIGRSRLWVSLYWLNPLVVKELMNSAHMEAVVLPFVLGAIALLALRRPIAASASLGLAIGAKLWPVMLVPLVLRPLIGMPWRLLAALAILGAMAVAWALPVYLGGLGSDSGFIAYATRWQTNSALFQLLQAGASALLSGFNLAIETPGIILRLVTVGIVAATAMLLSRKHTDDPATIINRAAFIVLVLFLLSPAQFPWYASWVLIFAPFLPMAGLLSLTVFLPLYYASFYLMGIDAYDRLNPWLLGAEWLPIWVLFLVDARRVWSQPLAVDLSWRDATGKRI